MKFRNHSLAIYTMLLLGTASFMGGCATTGMDRSLKTSNSIRDVDSEIRKMAAQIDVTAVSLDSLVNTGNPDLKKSFNTYSDNLDKLESEGKRVLKRLEEMKSHSKEYFEEWEKQGDAFTNSEIRELSEQRRSKLAEVYAQVPAAGAGIKGSYHAYLTDLKEIQKYLSNDLTPKGIEGITPVANKSVQNLDVLKRSLQPVILALDEIKAELYSEKK
jgi:myosin heavy subunit